MNPKRINVVLAGSPEIVLPLFEEVIKIFNVVLVITRPDKPAKRGMLLQEPPVKKLAQKYNILCLQPPKISSIFKELSVFKIDFFLTAAYGQIIPDEVLNLAKFSLNVHASLLPKYRGAAPIQRAILGGEKTTGICLMKMVKEVDAGDVFACYETNIVGKNATEVSQLLFQSYKENIVKNLFEIFSGKLQGKPQKTTGISFAPKLKKEECEIFQSDSIQLVEKKVLACGYNPGAYIFLDSKQHERVKLFRSSRLPVKQGLKISFQDGLLWFSEFQRPGKRIVKISSQ